MVKKVIEAVESLPEAQRQVIQRFYFDEQSLDSTAESLDKTNGAVRGLLQRARKSLAEYLTANTSWFAG